MFAQSQICHDTWHIVLCQIYACMHRQGVLPSQEAVLCCIPPKRSCGTFSSHAAPAGIRVSMKLPLMMCGTCSVPARAVPETSWQRDPSVLCAAPASEALSQPDFELFLTDLCVIAIPLSLPCAKVVPVLVSMSISLRCGTMHITGGHRVFLPFGRRICIAMDIDSVSYHMTQCHKKTSST